jgi:steroid delta-isomerase
MPNEHPAIAANKNSMANAMAGNKEGWLALFADDAIVYDPVGPSPHDPEGKGFRGREEISKFWDIMIGPTNLTIVPHKRYPCGNSCAVVMTAVNDMGGGIKTYTEMIAVYEVNSQGKIQVMKAYWELDKLRDQLQKYGISY